jgi:hypothetical protein
MPAIGAGSSSQRAKAAPRLLWLFYLIVVVATLLILFPDRHPLTDAHRSPAPLHGVVSP